MREAVAEPQQHTSCQFCAACRRGCAQVCSSAYCSLAWVNKEKTGAIRWTCQAWNSLLMFTPFTLGLSQRCCLSWFLTGPNCHLFFSQSKQTIPVVCHTKHLADRICPRKSAWKSFACWSDTGAVLSRDRQGVASKQKDDISVMTRASGGIPSESEHQRKMPQCIVDSQSSRTTFAWPAWGCNCIHSAAGEADTAAFKDQQQVKPGCGIRTRACHYNSYYLKRHCKVWNNDAKI